MSHIFFLKKNYKTSLKYANKAILINPNDDYTYYRKGFAHYRLKDYKKAKEAFLKAEELGCNYDDLYSSLSYIYSWEKNYKTALQYANKAILINPNDGFSHYRKGYALIYLEKISKAKDSYLKAEELDYKYDEMFFHLACVFCIEYDLKKALCYINKAILKNNKDSRYQQLKAVILFNLER